MVKQLKGKKHIKYIRRKAMRLWKDIHYQKGCRDDCIRATLEKHRLKVESDIKKNREELAKQISESKINTNCDESGWIG